jgi:hypothetical protein
MRCCWEQHFRGQAYAARGAGSQLDSAFAGQSFQMIFGRIGGFETQHLSNLCSSGRETRPFDFRTNDVQHLLLACSELGGHSIVC